MVPSLTSAKSKFLSLSISVLSLTIIWPFQAVAYDEAQLTRFKAIKKCRSCDLSSAYLSVFLDKHRLNKWVVDLEGANLTGADLRTELDLYKADLSNADLTGANIEGADFRDAIFCNTKTPWGLENIGCE